MEAQCRILSCGWTGEPSDLLEHVQQNHRKYIKHIIDGRYFTFTFQDVFNRAFLLKAKQGIYWFLISSLSFILPALDGIERGIFAIDGEEYGDYMVKLGKDDNDQIKYLGPFPIRSEPARIYDWFLTFESMDAYINEIPSKIFEIHFDAHPEEADAKETLGVAKPDIAPIELVNEVIVKEITVQS